MICLSDQWNSSTRRSHYHLLFLRPILRTWTTTRHVHQPELSIGCAYNRRMTLALCVYKGKGSAYWTDQIIVPLLWIKAIILASFVTTMSPHRITDFTAAVNDEVDQQTLQEMTRFDPSPDIKNIMVTGGNGFMYVQGLQVPVKLAKSCLSVL